VLVVNGVDATSGDYLLPPIGAGDLARAVLGAGTDARTTSALQERHRRRSEDHLAPRFGTDEADLSQTGWGVLFAADSDVAGLVTSLRPLLDLRRGQASTRSEQLYRELRDEQGYRRGETKDDFLRRHGAGPGPVRPEVLPFYLLLVGGPDEIPFEFQYQLGVQHAVGRIAFDDLAGYARYARNVVSAESRERRHRPVRFSVFAPRAEQDPATRLSSELLALPLAESLATAGEEWAVTRLVEHGAHKGDLVELLAGPERPDLLLTASHGVGFPSGHPGQREAQGALLCQDWPGPGSGPVTAGQYLAATDLAARPEIDLTGMVAVCFACFGAGTPRYDDFTRRAGRPVELAVTPFVAALPQELLGRENGAQAVVGHVDRAWSYSFAWPGAGAQTEVFRSLLSRIGAGDPLGAAMSYLTDRYAELATDLTQAIEQVQLGRRLEDEQLAGLWTAYADARDFVVIGDPAVSLWRTGRSSLAASPDDARHTRSGARPVASAVTTVPAASEPVDGALRGDPWPARATEGAIEVATYVSADLAQVAVDPASGRITGAELALLSHVNLDGSASHVVADPATASPEHRAAQEAVAGVHARLLEVSVAAQQAWSSREAAGGAP
jgi:hypothetical protein